MKPAMKLLVGTDGSPHADAALEGLKGAGLPSNGEIIVLTAAEVFLPMEEGMPVSLPRLASVEKAQQLAKETVTRAGIVAEQAAQKLKKDFPGWDIRHETHADSPAWALIKKADEWKADLIVVGAHGHSLVGRFLGSVSQMVLTQAPCSVRIGRGRVDSNQKNRILLALDGSSDSDVSAQAAAARSWPEDTEFFLLSVIDPKMSTLVAHLSPSPFRWFLEQADDQHMVLGRMLESHAKKLREKGFRATCFVKEGDPKRVLIEEAELVRADGIFLGARGLSPAKRLLLGGVSAAVAARAHCSVEVVRRG